MSRLAMRLAATLGAAVLVAGCGSSTSSSGTTSGAASPTPANTGAASTPTTATSTTGTATSGATTPSIAATAAACYQALKATTTLPPATKKKLEGVCAKAAAGDRAGFKKALQEACEEVLNRASIPEGPDKQAALAACKQK